MGLVVFLLNVAPQTTGPTFCQTFLGGLLLSWRVCSDTLVFGTHLRVFLTLSLLSTSLGLGSISDLHSVGGSFKCLIISLVPTWHQSSYNSVISLVFLYFCFSHSDLLLGKTASVLTINYCDWWPWLIVAIAFSIVTTQSFAMVSPCNDSFI